MVKKLLVFFIFLFGSAVSLSSQSQEVQELKKTGFYLEAAPTLIVPFAGAKFLNLLYLVGPPSGELRIGPGFQVAAGYDWEVVGLGAKFHMAKLDSRPLGNFSNVNPANFEDPALFGLDVESRIFFLDLAKVSSGKFRPYALIGSGFGLIKGQTNVSNNFYSGYEANFGLGVQWQPIRHLNIGLESGYRPLLFGKECIAPFPGAQPICDDGNFHTLNLSLNLGFHF